MTPSNTLVKIIESLPENERERVEEFISFVANESVANLSSRELRFDWAGGLSEFRGKFTSIELQKKAMDWIGEASR